MFRGWTRFGKGGRLHHANNTVIQKHECWKKHEAGYEIVSKALDHLARCYDAYHGSDKERYEEDQNQEIGNGKDR